MKRIDYRKEHKELYNPSAKEVAVLDIPRMNFLSVDGSGNPNTSKEYRDAVEALFAVAYSLKFMIKKGKSAIDYGVMPLEGLWWTDGLGKFDVENRDAWKWTSMIMQPEFVTEVLFNEAVENVKEKKSLLALSKMRFESFHEGLSVQIMHTGPYAAEKQSIEKLHAFIEKNGYEFNGKHHEIYLSDPHKSAPEKMKTVLRQPIKKRSEY